MVKRWTKILSEEQGHALVDFAASALVWCMMIFAVIEAGMMLYSFHSVAYAARLGSRYAVVRGSACSGFASACPAIASDVQTYIRGKAFPGIDPTKLSVSTAWAALAGGTCSPSASCNNPGNSVTVTVSYNFRLALPALAAKTITMHSSSEMVISQ